MKKELKIIIAIIIAVLVVAIILVITNTTTEKELKPEDQTSAPGVDVSEEVPEESRQLLEELLGDGNREVQTINAPVEGEEFLDGQEGEAPSTREIQTVTIAAGTSGIDIERGKVVTQTGEDTDTGTRAGTGNAPRASFPIDNPDDLPQSTTRLEISSSSITPNEFTVRPGQLVNLAVTNINDQFGSTLSEVFRFDDPTLEAIVLGLAKGQTKSISFNAPNTPGEYVFFSSQFNHRAQGAEGKMIVQ
jgi:hypothetical protein